MAIKVVKKLVSPSKYNIKCPYTMDATRIVVHNTYNDASARDEIAYMISNNAECSFHFAIDDKEVVQEMCIRDSSCADSWDGRKGREIAAECVHHTKGDCLSS